MNAQGVLAVMDAAIKTRVIVKRLSAGEHGAPEAGDYVVRESLPESEAMVEARATVAELIDTIGFCADEFRDKAHVAECRGDVSLARYYAGCSERVCLTLARCGAK